MTSNNNSEHLQAKIDHAVQWILKSQLPIQERVLIIILLRNGLRVSEIADPTSIKFINKFQALCYSRKNKNWRDIVTGEAAELIDKFNLYESLQYWKRNRFYYYRILKGVIDDVETSRLGNKAVTHVARNIQAQSAMELTNSIEAVKTSIGNRSEKATSRYLTRQQRRATKNSGILDPPSGTIGNVVMSRNGRVRAKK